MDIPVQLIMIIAVAMMTVSGIGLAINARHWTDWLAAFCYLFGAAFIAYGLHTQCPGMAIYHKC